MWCNQTRISWRKLSLQNLENNVYIFSLKRVLFSINTAQYGTVSMLDTPTFALCMTAMTWRRSASDKPDKSGKAKVISPPSAAMFTLSRHPANFQWEIILRCANWKFMNGCFPWHRTLPIVDNLCTIYLFSHSFFHLDIENVLSFDDHNYTTYDLIWS